MFYYVPLQHGKKLLKILWKLTDFIIFYSKILIRYKRMDGNETEKIIKPLAIMFLEYYFYLIAFIDKKMINIQLL